jgi:hypothetical protein
MLTRFTLLKELRARRNMVEACSELLHAVYTELDLLSNGSHLAARRFTKELSLLFPDGLCSLGAH